MKTTIKILASLVTVLLVTYSVNAQTPSASVTAEASANIVQPLQIAKGS
jgi:hypothetical protein